MPEPLKTRAELEEIIGILTQELVRLANRVKSTKESEARILKQLEDARGRMESPMHLALAEYAIRTQDPFLMELAQCKLQQRLSEISGNTPLDEHAHEP